MGNVCVSVCGHLTAVVINWHKKEALIERKPPPDLTVTARNSWRKNMYQDSDQEYSLNANDLVQNFHEDPFARRQTNEKK